MNKNHATVYAGISAPNPQRVAFFVGLSENIGPVKEHTSILFDRIVTNIGEAYDQHTGRFTSPINGTYQFNVVISAQGRQKVMLPFLYIGLTHRQVATNLCAGSFFSLCCYDFATLPLVYCYTSLLIRLPLMVKPIKLNTAGNELSSCLSVHCTAQ